MDPLIIFHVSLFSRIEILSSELRHDSNIPLLHNGIAKKASMMRNYLFRYSHTIRHCLYSYLPPLDPTLSPTYHLHAPQLPLYAPTPSYTLIHPTHPHPPPTHIRQTISVSFTNSICHPHPTVSRMLVLRHTASPLLAACSCIHKASHSV